jgi:hypothetical protein
MYRLLDLNCEKKHTREQVRVGKEKKTKTNLNLMLPLWDKPSPVDKSKIMAVAKGATAQWSF